MGHDINKNTTVSPLGRTLGRIMNRFWGLIKLGPKHGWFIVICFYKWMIWEVPYFQKHPLVHSFCEGSDLWVTTTQQLCCTQIAPARFQETTLSLVPCNISHEATSTISNQPGTPPSSPAPSVPGLQETLCCWSKLMTGQA